MPGEVWTHSTQH